MGVETASDRAVFVDTDDFGVTAAYSPAANLSLTTDISVIFDAAHLSVDLGSGAPVSSTNPMVMCRTADLTGGGSEGDRFIIDGVTYFARDVQPDGTGMTQVELQQS